MRTPGRLTELDALRGIAALAIVVFHAAENLPDRDLTILRFLRATPLRPLLDGRQPVIFFFVLSGLALTHALLSSPPRNYLIYVARRAIRLCLPASVVVLVSAMLYGGLHYEGPWPEPYTWLAIAGWSHPSGPPEILRQALLVGVDGGFPLDCVLWTLAHEFRLSIMLPVVVAIAAGYPFTSAHRTRNGAILLMVAGSMLFGLSLADHGLIDNRLADVNPVWVTVSYLYRLLPAVVVMAIAWRASWLPAQVGWWPVARQCCLLAGCVAGGVVLSLRIDGGGYVLLGTTPLLSFLATLYYAPCFLLGAALALGALDRFDPGPPVQMRCIVAALVLICMDNVFATTAASVLIIVLSQRLEGLRRRLRSGPLVFLGQISFSLYLVHVPLLLAMSHGLRDILPIGTIIAIWVPLTIPTAWVFWRLVEQPAQRLGRQLGQWRRPVLV